MASALPAVQRYQAAGVGPQQVIDNPEKELNLRSIFLLRDSILGVKKAF
jgi:hypothetical protein